MIQGERKYKGGHRAEVRGRWGLALAVPGWSKEPEIFAAGPRLDRDFGPGYSSGN